MQIDSTVDQGVSHCDGGFLDESMHQVVDFIAVTWYATVTYTYMDNTRLLHLACRIQSDVILHG